MNIISAFLISIGASLDAFAVSICRGLSSKLFSLKDAIKISAYFGVFQMMMPIIGFNLGYHFESLIYKIDHFIAFSLLFYIGINLIIKRNEEDNKESLLILAIATSIDALSIGVAYALSYGISSAYQTFILIGVITFIMSFIGYFIGIKGGYKYKSKAKVLGGIILMLIGIKILIEHLC